MARTMAVWLATGAALLAGGTAAAQTVPTGKASFAPCASCHGTKAGERKLGPTLFGVVGRKAASVPAARYSAAMKSSGIVWTPAALDAFLTAPRKHVPGTIMTFVGVSDKKKREALIRYLGTLR